MQCHTESISFDSFLNLNVCGTPHLSELFFFIYINNNTTSSERNYEETLFLFKLFNVEVFGKNSPTG